MSILSDLRDRVQRVNDGMDGFVRDVVSGRESDILELQRRQLLEGLSSSGEDMRPYYSEDIKPKGYFNSKESARRYSVWKEDLSYPYSANRNPDAPNLYINGKFHSELGVVFDVRSVGVIGKTVYAKEIMAKYGIRAFGLMWANWNEIFYRRGDYDELLNKVKETLYV